MSEIYVLHNQSTALTERLEKVLGAAVSVRVFPSEAELLERLLDSPQAVVLAEMDLSELMPFLARCRYVRSATALVAVLPDAADFSGLPVLATDCHWVSPECSDFALRNNVAGALRQASLLATLAECSQRDEVSNLFSRQYIMTRLTGELSLAKRHHAELSLVVLGIDCYQIYLDSYGYQFVNALLRFLGEQISGMIRQEDVLARIGDDEIGILLPRSSEAGAKVFVSRLVSVLNQQVFNQGTYTEEVLVSAGVVAYPLLDSTCEDGDTMVRYGRHALYQTKADGDEIPRVCLFSEIVPTF